MSDAEQRPPCSFRLRDLIALVAMVVLVTLCLLPAIRPAHVPAWPANCQSNLRQIGLALHNYHIKLGCFPPGAIYSIPTDGLSGERAEDAKLPLTQRGLYATGYAVIYPYMEQQAIYQLQEPKPWYAQPPSYQTSVIPTLVCPINGNKTNPCDVSALDKLGLSVNTTLLGVTDYVFCKGVTDAWCTTPANVVSLDTLKPDDRGAIASQERGMFDIAFPPEFGPHASFVTTEQAISDGLSHTFAVGEGACGMDWKLTRANYPMRRGATEDAKYASLKDQHPTQFTIMPLNTSEGTAKGIYLGSVFGCTLERLNQNPVTQTVMNVSAAAMANCRPSLDWDGAGPATGGGAHRTSNFRSAHRGGGNFLMADGSVTFISEMIDLSVYRALSTIAGREPFPDLE